MPTAEYLARKKATGICIDCTEPVFPGYIQCKKHRKMSRLREIKYDAANKDKRRKGWEKTRENRRTQGRCVRCGLILDPDADSGHVKCSNCREDVTARCYETIPNLYAL